MPVSPERVPAARRAPSMGWLGHSTRALLAVAFFGSLGIPANARAQVRASERATIAQTSDGTTLTIDYSRPRARGRTQLFGKTVTWGEVWTPGANWATTLDVSRDVSLDGHAVPKGKYSVWFIVQPDAWTLVLDPRPRRYHTEHPDSIAGQLRWKVQPADGPFAEILTWSFPEVRPDGAQLLFEWGPKRVTLNATVRPSHPIAIARADAEPFLGTYEWRWADEPNAPPSTMELYYEDGEIRQRYTPFPDWYPLLQGQPMVRINDTWFIPAIRRDGKIWEMVADQIYEFELKNGRAVSFEMYSDKDDKLGSGRRK